MFSYYGSKSKIVDYYPRPKYGKIIEPFAGSARYALKYWENEVLLVDKYPVVVSIWKWLQQCSEQDIMKLPLLSRGIDIRTLSLSEEEKLFLSFMSSAGSKSPSWTVSPFAAEQFEVSGRKRYEKIAKQLYKIRHWEIVESCYTSLDNQIATWFVDPPYTEGGQYYPHSSKRIDYSYLASWCKSRQGQVIVCENNKANWLPFVPMRRMQGVNNRNSMECIWSNTPVPYSHLQEEFDFYR